MTIDDLIDNFSFLSDWEDKYRYLIELGDSMEPFDESEKTDSNKVDGCMSQVWFTYTVENAKYHFKATSDAHIVRGLEAALLILINDKTAEEIRELNIEKIFNQIGLAENLSPTRRNGFYAMIERIQFIINSNPLN